MKGAAEQFRRVGGVIAVMLLSATAVADDQSLREIMVDLDADLSHMTSAMMREDFETIAEAAEAIAEHPQPGARERERLLRQLGGDAADFRGHDEAVHGFALKAVEAAEDRDMAEVYRYHRQIVESCLACHADFKDRIRGTGP